MSFLTGGGSSSSAPKPPPFVPTNIPNTADLALQFDTLGYSLSDQDFLSRFPGLVALRDQNIASAAQQVEGPLDPTVQNQFASSAMSNALSAFGGPTGTIGPEGSAARGAIAGNIAQDTQAKQDADRLQVMSLIQQNPERSFGISGADAVNMLIGNVLGQNQYKYQLYQSNFANANAQAQSGANSILSQLQIALAIAAAA